MPPRAKPYNGLLLIGPTGSGKTPLGWQFENQGIDGRFCRHFDFGAQLRTLADSAPCSTEFTTREITFIQKVLSAGKLLENEQFYLVEKMINAFVKRHRMHSEDLIILNGMPRHMGQARDIEPLVRIREIVYLRCSEATVFQRIGSNIGGDRIGRCDDAEDAVTQKIALFHHRTLPLIQHFQNKGVRIRILRVAASSTPAALYQQYCSLTKDHPINPIREEMENRS